MDASTHMPSAHAGMPAPNAMRAIGVETVGMTKTFGSLVALDDVSIAVEPGEFHALLGENGAGKSTLVKCMMGFYQPTRGQLLIDGRETPIRHPQDARAAGIGMVYQHFTLVPCLTAAENMVISRADVPCGDRLEEGDRRARRVHGPHAVPRVADRAGRQSVGGREAETRNPQAALSRPAVPHSRRTDIRADTGRGRRGAGSPARHGARRRHHGHDDHPQVPRGDGVCGQGLRPAARPLCRRRQGRGPLDRRDVAHDDRRGRDPRKRRTRPRREKRCRARTGRSRRQRRGGDAGRRWRQPENSRRRDRRHRRRIRQRPVGACRGPVRPASDP